MRALTLTQPWAGLVASGIKLVENRPRRMIKPEDFGKPFAIHASREIDERMYDRILDLAPEFRTGVLDTSQEWFHLSRITSAVIAVATIDSVHDPLACGIDPSHPDALAPFASDQRRWFFGPIGYVLRDVRALATPVPCKGRLGFWTLPADVARQVEEQLR